MSTSSLSRMPEVQAAVRALAGVGEARVAWPEPDGPATLRIVLQPGADRAEVTAAVLDTLRGVGDVDLSSLQVALPVPPGLDTAGAAAAATPSHAPDGATGTATAHAPDTPARHAPDTASGLTPDRAAERPVFEGLILQRSAFDVAVTVTLTCRGQRLVGEAQGLATRQSMPRVAAAATLCAVRDLLPEDVRAQVDWVDVHDAEHATRPGVVQVAVAVLSGAGEQVMVGTALVRDDVRDAAVRATLDALNRRLTRPCPPGAGPHASPRARRHG